jgi:multidrug resistance efflux pump
VAEGEELATLESASAATGPSQAARVLAPIRAPVSGIVTDIATAADDIVSPGQLMVTLVDPGKVWVTANIHESRIPQVQIGQSVRITVRTRTVRRKFWGRVEQIGRATTLALPDRGRNADISTPSLAEVPIRISLDSVGRELYPGMTADVRIRLNPRFFANSAREY